jgi:hypothetical protein
LQSGSSIFTHGDDAIGIFAQSVGGRGGVSNYAAGPAQISDATSADGSGQITYGNGGAVTVNTGDVFILTYGAASHGIFAQSVGAGGGVEAGPDGVSLIAGSTGATGSNGIGGAVIVNQFGFLAASGTDAIGIFGQSTGQSGNGPGSGTSNGVTITVNGSVQGGSGSGGWGVWVDSDHATNTVTVNGGASIAALSGQAINATGEGTTNVANYGYVSGSWNLGRKPTPGAFTNETSGRLSPSGVLSGNLINAGLIAPSLSNSYAAIPVIGNVQQTASGTYRPNVQFTTGQADELAVAGTAVLSGSVQAVTQSILPRISVPILTVDGTTTGVLTALPSPLFGYTVSTTSVATAGTAPSALASTSEPTTGTDYLLTNTSANFSPKGLALTLPQQEVAQNLQSVWQAGGTPAFGTFFAQLDSLAGANLAAYGVAIGDPAPQGMADIGSQALSTLQGFANNLDRCGGPNGATRIGHDGQCGWFLVSGGTTSGTEHEGAAGYGLDQLSYTIGGEARVAPNWFIDGALAYQTNWLKTTGGAEKAAGQTGFGGIGLRYQQDHWTVSAGIFGDAGSYSTTRYLTVLGLQPAIDGSPSINSVGGRVGLAYTFNLGTAYVRPRLVLDGIYVDVPGYQESGSSLAVMNFQNSSQGTFAATPAVEFGEQVDLEGGLALRLTLSTGVSLLSRNSWTEYSRFTGAPAGSADLATAVPMNAVAGQVGVGIELLKVGRYSLRGEYNGTFSQNTTINSGALAFQAAF